MPGEGLALAALYRIDVQPAPVGAGAECQRAQEHFHAQSKQHREHHAASTPVHPLDPSTPCGRLRPSVCHHLEALHAIER